MRDPLPDVMPAKAGIQVGRGGEVAGYPRLIDEWGTASIY